jgi:hypothetical protein
MSIKLKHITITLTLLLWGTAACGVLNFSVQTDSSGGPNDPEITLVGEEKDDQLSEKQTPAPTPEATPTPHVEPDYSFEPVTYHDEESGFELLHPSSWSTPGGQILGSRGYGMSFLESDEIKMSVTVYRWDPKRDLAAWSEHRELAWTGSSGAIVSKEEVILQGGQVALAYVIESVAGEDAFFLLTTIGDRYFELAGSSDLELLAEIASTVRIPQIDPPPPIVDDLDCRTVSDEDKLLWVACNIRDGIVSRNTSALLSWMRDPFVLGYWQSEWTEVTPEYMINALNQQRLPADPSTPMAFTTNQDQFPPLFGMSPYQMMNPELNLALVIYSEGWGEDGQDASLLFIAEDDAGDYYWHALLVAGGHFDK